MSTLDTNSRADDLHASRLWKLSQARLYGILDTAYVPWERLECVATEMSEGGCDLIQFRAKGMDRSTVLQGARRVMQVLKGSPSLTIINDWPCVAAEVDADGAHVGQEDGALDNVRSVLGQGRILGRSTHGLEQARAAVAEGADYIGVGPIFSTPTKPDYIPVGLTLIGEVARAVTVPQFCIGGIKLENLPRLIAAGARRVVIVSGILQAADIRAYCGEVRGQLAALDLLA